MIADFIAGFDKVKDHFLFGYCYHFAVILENVFPGGEIGYDDIAGHFLYHYQGKYYDASGEVGAPEIYQWVPYSRLWEYDSLLADRVYQQCVLKV